MEVLSWVNSFRFNFQLVEMVVDWSTFQDLRARCLWCSLAARPSPVDATGAFVFCDSSKLRPFGFWTDARVPLCHPVSMQMSAHMSNVTLSTHFQCLINHSWFETSSTFFFVYFVLSTYSVTVQLSDSRCCGLGPRSALLPFGHGTLCGGAGAAGIHRFGACNLVHRKDMGMNRTMGNSRLETPWNADAVSQIENCESIGIVRGPPKFLWADFVIYLEPKRKLIVKARKFTVDTAEQKCQINHPPDSLVELMKYVDFSRSWGLDSVHFSSKHSTFLCLSVQRVARNGLNAKFRSWRITAKVSTFRQSAADRCWQMLTVGSWRALFADLLKIFEPRKWTIPWVMKPSCNQGPCCICAEGCSRA